MPGGPCGFAGHQDWRLPSVKELQGIVDFQVFDPSVDPAFDGASCGAGCLDVTNPLCSCTQSINYWSSSTYQASTSRARYVDFDDGDTDTTSKTGDGYVRAVRSGS